MTTWIGFSGVRRADGIKTGALSEAQSYFSQDFEDSCRKLSFVETQIAELRFQNPEIIEQVEVLGCWGATLNAAEKKLGKRLGLAQRTALHYLFNREDDTSYGKLELHVRQSHRHAGSRNLRALDQLESAGVITLDYHRNYAGAPVTAILAVRVTELHLFNAHRDKVEGVIW